MSRVEAEEECEASGARLGPAVLATLGVNGVETKSLFTSNLLQCALKRIRIECASNPDSIYFGTFHITKMQYALSNRMITQSALCVPYIQSKSVSQHGDAPPGLL